MIETESIVPRWRLLLLLLLPTTLAATSGEESARNSSSIDVLPTAVASTANPQRETDLGVERRESPPIKISARRGAWSRDSYLEALRHSRTSNDPREGIISTDAGVATLQRRKEYAQGPVYAPNDSQGVVTAPRIAYGAPDRNEYSMVPSIDSSYSLPSQSSSLSFHGNQNSYGPPRPSYGPPSSGYPSYNDYSGGAYLPAQQAYGAAPSTGYGPVGHGISEPSIVHGFPSIDFSWPFALKLNAFTLAKILLKLVIFKMIVKFIAVICLLLFIPKLEIKKKGNKGDAEDEDEGRGFIGRTRADSAIADGLDRLTVAVTEAVEKYRELNAAGASRGFEDGSWEDYASLLDSYLLEEARAKS